MPPWFPKMRHRESTANATASARRLLSLIGSYIERGCEQQARAMFGPSHVVFSHAEAGGGGGTRLGGG